MNVETQTPMIEINGLKKSYGDTLALKGLNFSIPKGQIVGFLGPNGAGKSTTMKILTGYLSYDIGSVRVKGLEVSIDSDATRKLIGYLSENNPQYEDMMVAEYLSFIADIRKIAPGARKIKISRAVELCGLTNVYQKDISQLSKGYRQRVGLAQAILHEPELLILDEPTSGLDPNQIIEIRNLIKELSKETTILMSTHILQEAQSTCERILIINNGLLVADDTPEKLANEDIGSIKMEVISLNSKEIDETSLKNKILGLDGVIKVDSKQAGKNNNLNNLLVNIIYEKQDPRIALFDIIVKSDLVLLEFTPQKASLEETFRRLTNSK
jgi:ABC-2 type transport system ATP-binding protein